MVIILVTLIIFLTYLYFTYFSNYPDGTVFGHSLGIISVLSHYTILITNVIISIKKKNLHFPLSILNFIILLMLLFLSLSYFKIVN